MKLVARVRAGANVPTILLVIFAIMLWIAGGSSRDDVVGQALVRAAAWACVIALVLFGSRRPMMRGQAVLVFIIASGVIAAVQLIPLPPEWWAALPGRSAYAAADAAIGGTPPWRPLSIVPSSTWNALGSLIVPLTMALLVVDMRRIDDRFMLRVIICMVVAAMGLGLLQFAGVAIYLPIINGGDEISGNFANKNHFALVMAIGLILIPVWAFDERRTAGWRTLVAIALVLLLVIAILGSGSRAGMGLGVVALGLMPVLIHRSLRRTLRRYPPWALPATIGGIVAALVVLLVISIAADRAPSISRAIALDPSQDMRSSGFPTVWAMVREYFPFGTGLGSFDTIFRQHEPLHLLKLTYFNRAHNDFVEIVLDTGLAGLLLLAAAAGWWLKMTWHAWKSSDEDNVMRRVGSIMLMFVLLASVVDYPARTPIVMAFVVIAAVWLGGHRRAGKSTLPTTKQHL